MRWRHFTEEHAQAEREAAAAILTRVARGHLGRSRYRAASEQRRVETEERLAREAEEQRAREVRAGLMLAI